MTDFARTLRTWRRTRRLSQLDLAGEAGVSARHLSFLETGRARPSRGMVDRLAVALTLPGAAHNQMLTDAGFAQRFRQRSLGDAAMRPIRQAIDHMLTQHAPFPGLALDRMWRVINLNDPARMLFAPLGLTEGASLLDLMRNPALPLLVENWPEVANAVAQRLRTESAAQGGVPEFIRLAGDLTRNLGPVTPAGPVVPTIYRLGPHRLSLFATLAQFGTPEDLTLEDLRIELYFPADDATAAALQQMAAGSAAAAAKSGPYAEAP